MRRMNQNSQIQGRRFSQFLRDPRVYRLDFVRYEDVRTRRYETTKRKYSVEMRQKATIREKNRIQSIGKEFYKLASLLPDTNGIKRSHQRILQDTVAYIHALEVELKLIDEDKLLEQWTAKKERRAVQKQSEKNEKTNLNEKRFSDKVCRIINERGTGRSLSNAKICGNCIGDLPENYNDYIYGQQANHGNYANSLIDYRNAIYNTEQNDYANCTQFCEGEQIQQLQNASKIKNQVKQEIIEEKDDFNLSKVEKDWDIKESKEWTKNEVTDNTSNEDETKNDGLGFGKFVTGLKFQS